MITDANKVILNEGDRVYTPDFSGEMIYGTLKKNPYTHVSEWSVLYDDGEECAVLDFGQLFKDETE